MKIYWLRRRRQKRQVTDDVIDILYYKATGTANCQPFNYMESLYFYFTGYFFFKNCDFLS